MLATCFNVITVEDSSVVIVKTQMNAKKTLLKYD